jgi:transposase
MPPEKIDSLDDDLKPLVLRIVAQNAMLLGRMDDVVRQNAELLAQNAKLQARIAELEARNGQPPKTPDNSSQPPSSGQKANIEPSTNKTSRKGRAGIARALCENPDVTRDIYAERCACGTTLSVTDQMLAHAYDHIDLPSIRPITTRINLHKAQCPCCKARITAKPPVDMTPGSPFGVNIVALVTYLHACQMISYARMIEMLDGVFGLTISEGAIAKMLARAETSFGTQADKIAATVRASEVIASDETSARVKGKTWWQWTFNCATAVYHVIAETRGKCVPTRFLGPVRPKVWLSDRYGGQGKLADAHQYCLAHLIRDAQYAIDAGDAVFAPKFKALLQDACAVGRRRPTLANATIAAHRRRLANELARLLDCVPTVAAGRKLRDAIDLEARDKLFVFLTRRDIEPTNNASERALRMSVIFRKVTNGFRSHWGAKVYADVCSIVGTARMAGQTALAAIRAVLAAPAAA